MKEEISKDFTLDDIHKIREKHYESTKNMTKKEKSAEINNKAKEVEEEFKNKKAV